MKKTYKQGEYDDREVIDLLNKVINKVIPKTEQRKLTIHMFKFMGREIQRLLKERNVSASEIKELVVNTYANPPTPTPAEPKVEPVKESREERLAKENVFTTRVGENGKEVISFSEKGMRNLHSEDNEAFESVGKDAIDDHEDDGRIYKSRTVKRLSDGKLFYYPFTWNPEFPDDFWKNEITEL